MDFDKPCKTYDLITNKPSGYYHVAPENFDGYYLLHRYVYHRYHDVDIPSDVAVMHLCNNRSCIEITHLKLGTWAENSRYIFETTGRNSARGTRHGMSKLDEDKVRQIRNFREDGMIMKDIAKEIGVSLATIADVLYGRTWKHVL